jgi:hypothetical protein
MLMSMMAQAGDELWMRSSNGTRRGGEIVAVCGTRRGEPPYAVRLGDGRIRLVVPDGSAVIEQRAFCELES